MTMVMGCVPSVKNGKQDVTEYEQRPVEVLPGQEFILNTPVSVSFYWYMQEFHGAKVRHISPRQKMRLQRADSLDFYEHKMIFGFNNIYDTFRGPTIENAQDMGKMLALSAGDFRGGKGYDRIMKGRVYYIDGPMKVEYRKEGLTAFYNGVWSSDLRHCLKKSFWTRYDSLIRKKRK
jgi:hypothetical protein